MKRWAAMLAVLVGCGGSSKRAEDPAAAARAAERKRIEAMRPPSPYETRASRGYRAPTTCGQGPYRIEAAAVGARFGEQIEVNICAPRSLEGDYRLSVGKAQSEPRHFGSRNNSEYCMATAADTARRDAAGPSASSSTSAPPTGSSKTTRPATEVAKPLALAAVSDRVGETCPTGMFLTGIVDYGTVSTSDHVPWPQGTPLVLDLWSTEPLHLDGAIFIVIQRGVRADMTLDRWLAHRDQEERWRKVWHAYLDGEVTAGRAEYMDMTAHAADAPPPPRAEIKPPRPSKHAEWIGGYWQRDRKWIWSAGFWRVPESDIVAEQTVEAPVAPPPVKHEPAPPPPPSAAASATATASTAVTASTTAAPPPATAPIAPAAASVNVVWTPGYWAWNGTAYIWIEGAWRIPPQRGAAWVSPTWTPRRGRVVLKPGGWSIRIGR